MIDFRCLIFWLFLDLGEHETQLFELPPELSDPQKSPCVNVPEWFVREGGELCLSESGNGTSVIRWVISSLGLFRFVLNAIPDTEIIYLWLVFYDLHKIALSITVQ